MAIEIVFFFVWSDEIILLGEQICRLRRKKNLLYCIFYCPADVRGAVFPGPNQALLVLEGFQGSSTNKHSPEALAGALSSYKN